MLGGFFCSERDQYHARGHPQHWRHLRHPRTPVIVTPPCLCAIDSVRASNWLTIVRWRGGGVLSGFFCSEWEQRVPESQCEAALAERDRDHTCQLIA